MSSTSESPEPSAPAPVPRRGLVAALDLSLRIFGGLLAVTGAVLTGALELLLSTLRIGGVPTGVSVLIAVLANLALSWFAHRAVGRRWAVALPALTWFALMLVAYDRTDEGDILLAGDNLVGVAMIFTGSIAFATMAFRLILDPRR